MGSELEKSGWRQGSIASQSDTQSLCKEYGIPLDQGGFLIAISQSCDIASKSPYDPNVEFIVACPIEKVDHDYSHNKNPRRLHSQLVKATGKDTVTDQIFIELLVCNKVSFPKKSLIKISPERDLEMESSELFQFGHWLAARYIRSALPSTFNERLATADPKRKLKKSAARLDQYLLGLYLQIHPPTEIEDHENYSVNLLGLLPASHSGDRSTAEAEIETYAEFMRGAGFEVKVAVSTEDRVSVALINSYQRFYYDDISFRNKSQLPPSFH